MNCLILEDELPAQKLLLNYIDRTSDLNCVGVYSAVSEIPLVILNKVDLLFLDIQLPEINGLEFLGSMEKKPHVIITSAYREYAIDAFEEAVTDYLLKPFSYQRFLKAVLRLKNASAQHQEQPTNESFFVYVDKAFKKIVKSEIRYIRAEVDYVKIIQTHSKDILLKNSLNHWEEKLKNDGFVRVHRSFLVNFSFVEHVEGNMIRIGKDNIPIGKTYRQTFLGMLKRE